MTDYDLFDNAAATDSVFANKGALDPLADPMRSLHARGKNGRSRRFSSASTRAISQPL